VPPSPVKIGAEPPLREGPPAGSKRPNVAVVFEQRPARRRGFTVINGDGHDIRTPELEGRGVVIGLTPKGAKAKRTGADLSCGSRAEPVYTKMQICRGGQGRPYRID
jgi:hypothetical protein